MFVVVLSPGLWVPFDDGLPPEKVAPASYLHKEGSMTGRTTIKQTTDRNLQKVPTWLCFLFFFLIEEKEHIH